MRKKSKKKQIVAMTLALSVLSSSVGMCGASAAEALPDTDDSGLRVTVVPLADSNADTDTPADDTKTEKQPVASTGDNTDQPTDGEGDGDNTSSDDKPTIERPEQSETVETLPGTAEDNKDHIKGEDKDDTEDKGDSGEETPDTGDTDTGDTEEKGEEGSGSEETPEQPKETPEEKPEETPKEDDTDYSCAYDPDTGHFKVTFNIKEDAEGDQTIELSKVQEVVNAYGKQAVEEYLQTDEAKQKYDNYLYYGMTFTCTLPNGAQFIYDPSTGEARHYEEPGCVTAFDVSLSNGSKHTYVYKEGSLTVATPDMKNDDKTGIKGFDGQELPEDYVKSYLTPKYNLTDPDADGVIENIIDKALESSESNRQYYVDANGNLTTTYTKPKIMAGTPVKEINGKYYVYSEASDCYYGGFSASQVKKDANGQYVVKNTTSSKVSSAIKEDGSKYYAPWVRGSEIDATRPSASRVQTELNKYFKKNNTSLDQEVLKYYNEKDGTSYTTIEELLANNTEAEKELTGSESSNAALNPLQVRSSDQYDNFYQNILSFNVGNPSDIDESNPDHGHGHGSWASDGKEMTIGDYMAGKLNETPGAWDKANAYFNTLLANGMSEDEATWAAFTMATNIDGLRADNDYQNTAWNWYASMVLHQADGTLDLTKTDADGNVIGDDEGEGQTSFYLWKYETDKKTGEKDTMYCTYVEPTYTTNEDGEQVLEKDGFYCWVKYDPSKDKLTYTVTTTNGKLNIDYALLENVVYYLQEAIAPDGYDVDPEIYVICDEESYKELEGTEVTNPATGATSKVTADSWLGSILGGKTLSINFVNTATVPDPEPTPDPDPVPPVDPDIPVDPANPDNPPVQDETPSGETPVTPENPQNPAVQDAAPDAAALPQTGTTSWMAGVLASLGSLLLACGWFFTRKQYSPKH